MERAFCNGKKDFCENIDVCANCEFVDGSGSIDEWTLNNFLLAAFGEEYDLDRLRKLVDADKAGRRIIVPEGCFCRVNVELKDS